MLPEIVPSNPKAILPILTELYNPKAFFTHAALLRQASAHCAIFPTAASRRSLGRVSVPVWLIILSDQLIISGLVSFYLTNYLMIRGLILQRNSFPWSPAGVHVVSGISSSLGLLSQTEGQITHALLTRAPLYLPEGFLVRLACVRHAASVRSEPGSNSPV